MSDLDDIRNKFVKRLEQLEQSRAPSSPASPPPVPPVSQAAPPPPAPVILPPVPVIPPPTGAQGHAPQVAEYDAWIAQEIQAHLQDDPFPAAPPLPATEQMTGLAGNSPLLANFSTTRRMIWADEMLQISLGLPHATETAGMKAPVYLALHAQDFSRVLAHATGLSASQLAGQIDGQKVDAGGVHLFGIGTVLNGAALAARLNLAHPQQVLEDPRGTRELIARVAQEKWGYGLISEHTPLGQAYTRLQIWPGLFATRYGVKALCPASIPVEESAELYDAARITQQGWGYWTRRLVLDAADPYGEAQYSQLGFLAQTFEKLIPYLDDTLKLAGKMTKKNEKALRYAFTLLKAQKYLEYFIKGYKMTIRWTPDMVKSTVEAFDALCAWADPTVYQMTGRPLSALIGGVLLRDVAARIGPRWMPYAVLAATNVPLQGLTLAQALQRTDDDWRAHPDMRLCRLTTLPKERRLTLKKFRALLKHQLEMELPEPYRNEEK